MDDLARNKSTGKKNWILKKVKSSTGYDVIISGMFFLSRC